MALLVYAGGTSIIVGINYEIIWKVDQIRFDEKISGDTSHCELIDSLYSDYRMHPGTNVACTNRETYCSADTL